jgi:hypothetical protein
MTRRRAVAPAASGAVILAGGAVRRLVRLAEPHDSSGTHPKNVTGFAD